MAEPFTVSDEDMSKESGIYAFFGSDYIRVKEAAAEMVARLAPPDAGDFGIETIDGVADNAAAAACICHQTIAALQTLPFFGGEKVVWLKGATFLGDDQTGKAAATLEGVAHLGDVLAEGIGDEVSFVISSSSVDKRRAFYKRVGKLAKKVEELDKIDISRDDWVEKAISVFSGRARDLGLSFAPGAMEAFVMRAGEDTGQAESELQKLALYVGEGKEVTEEVISEIVSPTRHGVIYEIGGAIARRNLSRSLQLMNELLGQGEGGVGILLGAIVPKVRSLFWARVLGSSTGCTQRDRYPAFQAALSRLPQAQTAHLPRTKEGKINAYPIYLSLRDASRFTGRHLRRSLAACLDANRAMVTTSNDHEVILTRLLVAILAPA